MKKHGGIFFLIAISVLMSSCTIKTEDAVMELQELPVEEKRVSFYAAGDNLIHNSVYWQADRNAPGDDFDFKPMYQLVADDIRSADIAYLNQETVLGGTELTLSSYPLFNSPQELGRDMIDLGFDVFSHATNHVVDKGEQGIANTYRFYQNQDVLMVGIYEKEEDTVKILEKNGVKIAFLNYTYLTNGLSPSANSAYHVTLAQEETMVSDIKKADTMADFVVCFLHWGDENHTTPNDTQKQHAKLLSDAGCDAIIGTHSHTIQPVEFAGDTLVVYSLGNYISAQNKPVNLVGGTVFFDMVINGDEKKIENVKFEPVITQYESGCSNIRIIPFSQYTKELAQSHGAGVSYEYFETLIADFESRSCYRNEDRK